MEQITIILYGMGLFLIGFAFLAWPEKIVAVLYRKSGRDDFADTLAFSTIRVVGIISMFMFIMLLCGIWTNS